MNMQHIRDRHNLKKTKPYKSKVGSTLRYEIPGRYAIPLTFGLFLILLIVLSAVALNNMWNIESNFETTVAVHGKKLQLLDDLLRKIQKRQLIVNDIIMLGDPFEKGHILLISDIKNSANQLLKMQLNRKEQELISTINFTLDETYKTQSKALEQALMSNSDKAYAMIKQDIRPKIKHIYEQLLLLRKHQDHVAQTSYLNSRQQIQSAQVILLTLCAAAIIFGGLVALNVLRRVHSAFNGYYHSLNAVYAELEETNYTLRIENRERKRAESQLKKHRDDLESRVAERTIELQQEIQIRSQTEHELRLSKGRIEAANNNLSLKNNELTRSMQNLRQSRIKVAERTQALQISNDQLQNEINERQQIEQRLRETQQEMIEVAHRAGMSEIITGVLHNVGNVLNTVKTSGDMIYHGAQNTQLSGLLKANTLLKSHQSNLSDFFTNNPKSQSLINYYFTLGDIFVEEQQQLLSHSKNLHDAIIMMSDIINAQQNYAKSGLLTESLQISGLLEDALHLQISSMSRHNIKVEKRFHPVPDVHVQKVKLLEIMMNLLKNAKEAMSNNIGKKQLVLEILPQGDKVLLKITDNGEGIASDNLEKIFAHGFTTKDTGHGFGLHASANAMAEMGGTLSVQSKGLQQGATFTVSCPTRPLTTHE